MFEAEAAETLTILRAGGWTVLTAINLMLFSLIHNPCSTTLFTIYKETGSWKWTLISALLPLTLGLTLCVIMATLWRLGG
jgi:ferrous iron transport protein B